MLLKYIAICFIPVIYGNDEIPDYFNNTGLSRDVNLELVTWKGFPSHAHLAVGNTIWSVLRIGNSLKFSSTTPDSKEKVYGKVKYVDHKCATTKTDIEIKNYLSNLFPVSGMMYIEGMIDCFMVADFLLHHLCKKKIPKKYLIPRFLARLLHIKITPKFQDIYQEKWEYIAN